MDYKNKLEEAKRLYKTANADQRYVLESLFPELKESEDEKIRNEIILYVGARNDISLDTHNRWLSWLEKQCEKIPVVEFNAKDWYISKVDGKIYNAKFMEKTPTNQVRKLEIEKAAMSATGIIEQEEWFIKGAEWSDKNPCYISSEKPNKQKPINNQFTPEQAGVLDKHIDKFLGQEPADKVEPKFHEGDFVVDNCGYVWKIKGALNQLYVLEGIEGGESRPTIEWVNKTFHLWTIKDAKEGDVLYCKNSDIEYIVMNKGVNEHGNIDSYFRYNSLNGFGVDIPSVFSSKQDDITPATKEQRDTLFAKMKEAGYKWDTEKKELRKIEQRPAYKVEPKSDFELCLKHIMEEAIECGDTHNLKADAELLYNIAQKSAEWSDEDEQMVLSIEQVMNCASLLNIVPEKINKIRSWLKSLRPQPKQEWSEEDEITRNALINLVEMYYGSCINQSEKDRLLSWLKSLRPKPKQEWREEDEKRRKNVLRLITEADDRYIKEQSSSPFCAEILWLKSLKDRITWKPSEKQIGALNYAYCELFKRKDVGHNILGPLQELCDELKKL